LDYNQAGGVFGVQCLIAGTACKIIADNAGGIDTTSTGTWANSSYLAGYTSLAKDIYLQSGIDPVQITLSNSGGAGNYANGFAIYARLPSSAASPLYQCADGLGGTKTTSAVPTTPNAVQAAACQ
jgi:hypothetical protein